jgi:protein disulfide-isomerase A1
MDKMKLISLVVLAAFASAHFPEEEDVIVLSDPTFDHALEDFPQLLVEFYAPWCGHCKKLAPEYAKAGAELKRSGSKVKLAKLDATENKETADKYGVTGFPTLKWFDNGEIIEYSGGKTAGEIIDWINKKLGPAAKVISSLSELKQFIDDNKITVVFFGKEDSTEAENFKKAVKSIEGAEYAITTDSAALSEYGLSEPSIMMFKHHDDRKVNYTGNFDVKNMKEFVTTHKRKWIMEFGEDAIQWIFEKMNPGLFIFRKESDHTSYTDMLEKLAPEIKEHIQITVADLSDENTKRLADYLGLATMQMPFGFIVSPVEEEIKKYMHTGALSYDTLKEFVNNWKNKALHPFMKSEPIPTEPYDGRVRVLVGQNFEDVVYDTSKDVMVEFYAPWCGHCKKLAPEYEKAAEMFKDVPSVVLAKIEATANEVKGHSVTGFPTLKFFPANNKAGLDYQGPRDAKGIVDFIRKKAGIKIDETTIKTEL